MVKLISILGSTGSIGLSTLNIISKKKKLFRINLLSANKNFTQICYQIKKYKPYYFVITNKKIFNKVKKRFNKNKTQFLNDFKKINKIKKNYITISAIPGIAGLLPTLSFIKISKKILIANKESIICGWNLIDKDSKKYRTEIIPIDSEHFSLSKLLKHHNLKEIKKIYITASGGPFLNFKVSQLKKISPRDALKHPKWKMGKKITIDSATLMNKILELIEAYKLFNISKDKLDIIIHPESLIHAIVELKNGLTKFLYHETSMIIPLANAIFEDEINISEFYSLKEKKIKNLNFKSVDPKIFPIIKIKNRINELSSTPIILNASNEIFVDQFLQKKIPFLSIFKIIMSILNDRNYRKYAIRKPKNIKEIKQIDLWARELTMKKIKKL